MPYLARSADPVVPRDLADKKAMRRGAMLFLALLLGANAVMLVVDAGRLASGSAGSAAVAIGVSRLVILSVAGWLAATVSRAGASALATFLGCLFSSGSAVLLAEVRNDPATMIVTIVVTALGASVLVPWSPRWQVALVVSTFALIGLGIGLLSLAVSPLLLAFCFALVVASIYLARIGEQSRRELAMLVRDQRMALEVAEERQQSLGDEIRDQTRGLEDAAGELASFCHAASHDIRPPLRTMAGYSEILEEGFSAAGDEEAGRAVKGIPPLAKSMGEQIDALLEGVRSTQRSMAGTLLSLRDVLETECARTAASGPALRAMSTEGLYADDLGAVVADLLRAVVGYLSSAPFRQAIEEIRLAPESGASGYLLLVTGGRPGSEETAFLSRCLRGDLSRGVLPDRFDELTAAARAWRVEHGTAASVRLAEDGLLFRFGKPNGDVGDAGAPA